MTFQKIFLNLCMLLIFQTSIADAHPPQKIDISYNSEELQLDIAMTHVSSNIRKHFIRKIEIFKKGTKKQSLYFTRQKNPQKILKNIPIELAVEDMIDLKFFCSFGGVKEMQWTLPAPELDSDTKK